MLNGIGRTGLLAGRALPARRLQAHRRHHRRTPRPGTPSSDFDGVLTFSESAVITVAAVAEALGLPGIGVEAARTSRNKLLMRQAHERGGVPRSRASGSSPTSTPALAAAEEFGYPVILKPTLGAASNFVFRVDDPDELRERFAQAQRGHRRGCPGIAMEADGLDLGPHGLLVESFLDGQEYLIEALAWDDEVYLGSIVDRVTVEGDTFDDDVHHAPTSLDPRAGRRGARGGHGRRARPGAAAQRHARRGPLPPGRAAPAGDRGPARAAAAWTTSPGSAAGYYPIGAMMDVARGRAPGGAALPADRRAHRRRCA